MDGPPRIEFTRDDIEGVANLLAAWLAGSSDATVHYVVEDIVVVDIASMVSGVAGLQDPLGQLRQFFTNILNTVAAHIIAALQGIIEAVGNTIRQMLAGIQAAISQIPSALNAIKNAIERVVVTPILQALQWVQETFPTIVNTVKSFINTLRAAIAEIPRQIANIVNTIVDAVRGVVANIQSILSGIVDGVRQALSAVMAFIDSLRQRIHQAFAQVFDIASRIGQAILSGINSAIQAIQGAINAIVESLSRLPQMIVNAVNAVVNRLQGIFDALVNTVSGIVQTITSAFQGIIGTVTSIAQSIVNAIQGAFNTLRNIIGNVAGFIENFARQVVETLSRIPEAVVGIAQSIQSTLASAFENILNAVRSFSESIASALSVVYTRITEFVNTIVATLSRIPGAVAQLLQQIHGVVAGFAERLQAAFSAVVNAFNALIQRIEQYVAQIGMAFNELMQRVNAFVASLVETLQNAAVQIVDIINNVIAQVRAAIESLVDTITNAVTRFGQYIESLAQQAAQFITLAVAQLKDFILNLPNYAVQAIENVTVWIWEHLPDWVKTFLTEAPKALELIGRSLTGFINAIMQFPNWFPNWFQEYIAKPIVEAITAIADLFENVYEKISAFFAKVGDKLTELIDALSAIFKPYASFLLLFRERGMGVFAELVEQLLPSAIEFVKRVIRLGFTVVEATRETIEAVVRRAADIIAEPLGEMIDALISASRRAYSDLKAGKDIATVYREMFAAIVPYTMSATAIVETVRATGEELNRATSMAIGMTMTLAAAEGAPLVAFANILDRGAWAVVTQVPFSVAFWLAEPLKKPLDFAVRYALRNELPIEIPTLTQIRDILRRAMAAGKFEELNKTLLEYIKMRGFSDEVINLLFGGPEVLATTITDRFGGKRLVPLTLLWETPTRTDLIRMLQRDVLQSPMEWARFIAVYGLNEDLGKLYYLASFEYPSFEKLWEFFVRGISGMLWYVPPEFIQEWFKQDAEWLGAGVPVPPKNLNYDYKALFKAIPFYLKWIQKSNFSWFRKGATLRYGNIEIQIDFDWTADSWMLWDIAADLPGKIDARWMAKWGLFDLISEKAGITVPNVGQSPTAYPEVPFVDLVSSVVESNVTSPVVMDLRAFSRLLVANGLHPAWVPITAVAEAINALSDERTLLRTGFLNLFKEGFWSIETVDKLLEGFVTASFIVEYFDPTRRQWVAGVINTPVKFLPAERKLLELRALMDRALDILRDAAKEAVRAYTENVVETYNEMMELLNETIASVNKWFAREVREITGKELELGLDKPYWEAYKTVANAFREIFTVRRIRYWVGRVLGWLFYRLAYGYVKPDDIKTLFEHVAKVARLVPEEREFIEQLMEMVVGIAKREYIPTPSQLATIAEIVPEVTKLAEQVFEARGVPEEWRPIWLRYIQLKPVADEVRRLLSTAITYYAKGVITDDELKAIFDFAKGYGWTDAELDILKWIAEIRKKYVELREESRQYIPTPSQLATIAEVVPEAAKLVNEVFEARHVPPEWQPIWQKYIEVKPVYDNVRHLMSAYARALRLGVDLGELAQRVLEVAKWAGWTERELQILQLWAAIEQIVDEAIYMRKEYLPTPMTLATLAEYVTLPPELIKEALEKRGVPEEWVAIWLQYIRVRPLADEARLLATAYFRAVRYGVPLGDIAQQVVEILKQLGFTEEELKLRELRATIEALIDEWREAQREYIPTPSMMASIAEVAPEVRKLLPEVLAKRNVPPEWVSIWTKYVAIKPLLDEVRGLLSSVRKLYEYFAIRHEEFRRWLERLKPWGFEDREIQLILARSEVERARRAWMELVGTPKSLVTMAEYSPTARRVALSLVERMIDALPTDDATKQFLKQMWREYIKVKPVYDEVRRYITELITDYANGVITRDELRAELEALREWGIDDYEIEFYLWLAERRRQRYARRRR